MGSISEGISIGIGIYIGYRIMGWIVVIFQSLHIHI
jgi:hypothetical protein